MRIVIDMQGAQTESRFRGIGRYTMSFAQAVVRNRGEHEVILVLNGLFPNTIEPIRMAFEELLPRESIRVWYAPGPVNEGQHGNENRRAVAELLREAFIASLQADIVHLTSLVEGFVDDAVTSIGRLDQSTPVSVTLYDLIPLLNPAKYLEANPRYEGYYRRKIDSFAKASILLAISDYAKQEALGVLAIDECRVTSVSTAAEGHFIRKQMSEVESRAARQKYFIERPFVLYTGGADERKNLPRLIEAYAAMGEDLRNQHQLVLAGKMPAQEVAHLKSVASNCGLQTHELLFTGYISDEDLIALYNLCKLYVFPSWHEGFGLPALEAMACGAPVIGANTTSLPEVIGLGSALFDPFDVDAILAKMKLALSNDVFRQQLRDHAQQQVERFTWDITATRALGAWQEYLTLQERKAGSESLNGLEREDLLSAIAPYFGKSEKRLITTVAAQLAQNESSGIERQILVDVSELCQHDAATGVQRVVRSYLYHLLQNPPRGFRVQPVYASQSEGYRYARSFTQRMYAQEGAEVKDTPIRWQRGDLFFGLDMQHHVQLANQATYARMRQDGVVVKFLVYDLLPIQLADFFKDNHAGELHENWLAMIALQDEAICISKATADAYNDWISSRDITKSAEFRTTWVHMGADIEGSKPSRGLPEEATETLRVLTSRPTFLAVSTLEPRKAQTQILNAVEHLWSRGDDINLVLVGQQGWKVDELVRRIASHPENGKRLFWLKGISDEYLNCVYRASSCLISASINEGFGLPLIEAASHGIPIIARDIPVFREVAGDSAFYFNGETGQELADAINEWLHRHHEGAAPQSTGLRWDTWQQSTEKLKTALVNENFPTRQLLVDVSELAQRDAKSGIQRVVRNILREWLRNPPSGYRVEPVYAAVNHGYRYAKNFQRDFLELDERYVSDDPIEVAPGDIFLGLDLAPAVVPVHQSFYQELRALGVGVKFVVYDLQPLIPDYFEKVHEAAFLRWLHAVVDADELICISNSVANEVRGWLDDNAPELGKKRSISYFHLGADIVESTDGTLEDATGDLAIAERINAAPSFLMVSTLAPHKGHAQVLESFELLWERAIDVNLVLVGKAGWCVDELVEKLREHPQLDRRLFWLNGISDSFLETLYRDSGCLISASYSEGFGLPLIEAAQYQLPIIARDIPIFREVAGNHAYYFDCMDPQGLADAIENWLDLYAKGEHPVSGDMPWLTWRESAEQLLNLTIPDNASGIETKKEVQ